MVGPSNNPFEVSQLEGRGGRNRTQQREYNKSAIDSALRERISLRKEEEMATTNDNHSDLDTGKRERRESKHTNTQKGGGGGGGKSLLTCLLPLENNSCHTGYKGGVGRRRMRRRRRRERNFQVRVLL